MTLTDLQDASKRLQGHSGKEQEYISDRQINRQKKQTGNRDRQTDIQTDRWIDR